MAKMNPPLREQSDIDTLKAGILDHTISILATDHAPHPLHTKECSFAEASFGIVGLECALALYAKALIDEGSLDWVANARHDDMQPCKLDSPTSSWHTSSGFNR